MPGNHGGSVRRSNSGSLVVLSIVALIVSGCASPLRPMPNDVLAQLKPGVTTTAEAEAALGAPDDKSTLPDGGEEWVYEFAPEPVVTAPDLPAPADPDRPPDVLLLVFNPVGVLVRHEANRSLLGVRDAAHPPQPDHEALKEIQLK